MSNSVGREELTMASEARPIEDEKVRKLLPAIGFNINDHLWTEVDRNGHEKYSKKKPQTNKQTKNKSKTCNQYSSHL